MSERHRHEEAEEAHLKRWHDPEHNPIDVDEHAAGAGYEDAELVGPVGILTVVTTRNELVQRKHFDIITDRNLAHLVKVVARIFTVNRKANRAPSPGLHQILGEIDCKKGHDVRPEAADVQDLATQRQVVRA